MATLPTNTDHPTPPLTPAPVAGVIPYSAPVGNQHTVANTTSIAQPIPGLPAQRHGTIAQLISKIDLNADVQSNPVVPHTKNHIEDFPDLPSEIWNKFLNEGLDITGDFLNDISDIVLRLVQGGTSSPSFTKLLDRLFQKIQAHSGKLIEGKIAKMTSDHALEIHVLNSQHAQALKDAKQALKDEKSEHAQALKDEKSEHAQALKDEKSEHAQALKDAKQALKDEKSEHAQALKDAKQALKDEKSEHAQALKDEQSQHAQALKDKESQHTLALQNKESQHTLALQDKESQHKLALQVLIHEKEMLESNYDNSEQKYQLAIQQVHELRSAYMACKKDAAASYCVTFTRAQAWELEQVDEATLPRLEPNFALTQKENDVIKGQLDKFAEAKAAHETKHPNNAMVEKELYEPIQEILVSCLVKKANVKITSHRRYLSGMAPDISVSLAGVDVAHAATTYGIIEVKRPDNSTLDTAERLGQMRDYLLALMGVQKSRTHFWGFLTDMKHNILIELTRLPFSRGKPYNLTKYASMPWPSVLNYIRQATGMLGWGPPPLRFHKSLGNALELFGKSKKWNLGLFEIPGHDKHSKSIGRMVVKISLGNQAQNYHIHELKILRHIKATRERIKAPPSIPSLVWDVAHPEDVLETMEDINGGHDDETNDYSSFQIIQSVQFGITPVGEDCANMTRFRTRESFKIAIDSLLDGLQWLHETAKVVHRDIRSANIVWDMKTGLPVIIDYDCAFQLNDTNFISKITTYSGGLICIPKRVLIQLTSKPLRDVEYTPDTSDDLIAFVIMVMQWFFPEQTRRFATQKLTSGDQQTLQEMLLLHEEAPRAPGWGTWWEYAEERKYEKLKGIHQLALFCGANNTKLGGG